MKHTQGPWLDIQANEYAGSAWIEISVPQTNKNLIDQSPVTYHATSADIKKMKAAPELLIEAKKQVSWLQHIKPQITAPDSVMMGFDQSIKYLSEVISKAEAA